MIRGSTLIVVATAVELLLRGADGEAIGREVIEPTDPRVAGVLLRAQVDEILYCAAPCPNQAEVTVAIGLASNEMAGVEDRFIHRKQIFLLIDRRSDRGEPADLKGKWLARSASGIRSFLPLERRADVMRAIETYKPERPR